MLKVLYLRRLHWFLRLALMALLFLGAWFIFAYLLPKILPQAVIANESRSGLILRNERWKGEVRVTGDIWSVPGAVVTVEPGTRITVESKKDKFNLHWLPWDLRSGINREEESFGVRKGEPFWDEKEKVQVIFAKLYALGTKEQPILIESETRRPGSPYDFNVLSLEQGVLSHVRASNYRQLRVGNNVTIRDSYFENVSECAICANYSSPTIANNIFNGALREYIRIVGGSSRISDNVFKPSGAEGSLAGREGVVIDPKRIGAPVVYHNNFEMPGQVAVRFLSGDEENGGAVSLNNFAGGSTIVIPCDSRVKIIQNEISGLVELSNSGNCVGSMVLGPNYWYTKDRMAILREKVIGREAGFEVLIPSVLSSSPSGAGRRSN